MVGDHGSSSTSQSGLDKYRASDSVLVRPSSGVRSGLMGDSHCIRFELIHRTDDMEP